MTVVEIVNLALSLVTLAIKGWAFVDACFRPSAAFAAVGRMSKTFWTLVLGLSTAAQVAWALLYGWALSWIGLLSLIGIVVALVYAFGIRPEVIKYGGGRRGGRSSSEGPYGPW
jgi:Protein of unknown function (DUF2516)